MIDLLVDVLAVHRITRLVTADLVTRPWRTRLIRSAYERSDNELRGYALNANEASLDALPHDDDLAPKLATLVTCPWCVSIYAAAGVLLARRYAPGVWRIAAYGLALSTASTLIANRETPR